MAKFLDFLKSIAEDGGQAPSQADPQSLPAPSPSDNPPVPAVVPTTPDDTSNTYGQDLNVVAHRAASVVPTGFKLPMTAADQPSQVDDTPGASDAPQASPQEIASTKSLQGLPDHKGMFGVHGTLRDVLGTLGDAFLIQGGAKPIYAPVRQQERESDALVGLASNPQDTIGRLAGDGRDPAAAMTMRNQLVNQDIASERAQSTAASQGGRLAIQKYQIGSKLYAQAANAYATATDPASKQRVLGLMAGIKQQYGLGDEFTDPASQADAQAAAVAGAPQVVQAAQNAAETHQNHQASQSTARQNADSSSIRARAAMKNANKPSAGSRPTNASMAAQILQRIQNGTATPSDIDMANRLGYGNTAKPKGSILDQFKTPATVPSAPSNPKTSTQPAAFKSHGWIYDAQGHPIRKAG